MQSTIFEISLFGIRIAPTWYGAMYGLGFIFCYLFMKQYSSIKGKNLDDLLLYVFFGVIFGGRLGYVVLYDPAYFFSTPLEIFKIWNGGMSFHGGILGVICSLFIYSRKKRIGFFSVSDPLAIIIPLAIGLGRLGNYINKELPGFTPYDGLLAMNISGASYFPSPLLELLLEGIILLLIMLYISRKLGFFRGNIHFRYPGLLSGVFLIGYSIMRIFAEFFRLPDKHIGYLFSTDWMTLGMIYTVPLLVLGILIVVQAKR